MVILLIAREIKNTLYKMSQYFPKTYNHLGRNVKVQLNLYNKNYTTKADLKNARIADISKLTAKSDLAS